MSDKTQQLRNLPAVDEVLRDPALERMDQQYPRPMLVEWIRAAVQDCRSKILAGEDVDTDAATKLIVSHVVERSRAERGRTLQRVINATGVMLHTNLGRAPLPQRAIDRMEQAAGYTNVELDLAAGKRSKRGGRATDLLAQLAGAEDAVVVNNCAGATMLVLQAIAKDREVIISRGQLVEIGGGFRLPDVFTASGVLLREVGTTNRTYLHDYENAVGENTGAIIRVHRSNFKQTGFVTEPTIEELVAAERDEHIPVIDDIGSGCICDLTPLGLHEPVVSESVAAGADLTLFSGDKLFGGPQCGIVVGRSKWIAKLRRSPIMRAVRVDKVTLAALEATTEIHLAGKALDEIPLLMMMFKTPEETRAHCQRVCERLTGIDGATTEVVACESQIGGGSIPGATLPSFGVRVSTSAIDDVAQRLRTGTPAVQPRLSQDSLLLDLRTVAAHEVETLADCLVRTLQRHTGGA